MDGAAQSEIREYRGRPALEANEPNRSGWTGSRGRSFSTSEPEERTRPFRPKSRAFRAGQVAQQVAKLPLGCDAHDVLRETDRVRKVPPLAGLGVGHAGTPASLEQVMQANGRVDVPFLPHPHNEDRLG